MAPQLAPIGAADRSKGSEMPELINWELLRNPINWIIVALMLAIGAVGLALVFNGPALYGSNF